MLCVSGGGGVECADCAALGAELCAGCSAWVAWVAVVDEDARRRELLEARGVVEPLVDVPALVWAWDGLSRG